MIERFHELTDEFFAQSQDVSVIATNEIVEYSNNII